jgi:hypothetical protein
MTSTLLPARSIICTVHLNEVTVDPRVQRAEGVDQRRVDEMAANFNPDALGLFILSRRPDGNLVCLDGMHRATAARQVGWALPVDARVFTGLTLAEEAALFLLYNRKKDPSVISRFHARVLAGDEIAAEVHGIARTHGWTIRGGAETGTLKAVAALEKVHRDGYGTLSEGRYPEVSSWTLAAITAAWGHDPVAVHETMLAGFGQLYGRFSTAIDTEKLVRELQDTQPRPLRGKAEALQDIQGGTKAAALAKILVGLHNHRRRTSLLPDWVWVR